MTKDPFLIPNQMTDIQEPNVYIKRQTNTINMEVLRKLMPYISGVNSGTTNVIYDALNQLDKLVITLAKRDAREELELSRDNVYVSNNKTYYLSSSSWDMLNTQIKMLLLGQSKKSSFNGLFLPPKSKQILEAFTALSKNVNSLYHKIDKFYFPLKDESIRVLGYEMIKPSEEPVLEHKLQWLLGKKLLEALCISIKTTKFTKCLVEELRVSSNINIILNLITKKTPAKVKISLIEEHFVLSRDHLKIKDAEVAFIVILFTILQEVRDTITKPFLLMKEKTIITCLLSYQDALSEILKTPITASASLDTFKPILMEDLTIPDGASQSLDTIMFLKKLSGSLLNVLNIYIKTLGIEITNILKDYKIMSVKNITASRVNPKNIRTHFHVIFNTDKFEFPMTREIPDLVKTRLELLKEEVSSTDRTAVLRLEKPTLHENDTMESKINDIIEIGDARSFYKLNIDFVNAFFRRLLTIVKAKKRTKFQEKFIGNIYELNFDIFETTPEYKKSFIKFASNFATIKRYKRPTKIQKDILGRGLLASTISDPELEAYENISDDIIKTFANKIHQQKLVVCEIFFTICLLSRFQKFTFNFFYDARGRNYPDPSSFNYLRPFVRNFITFSDYSLNPSENINYRNLLGTQYSQMFKTSPDIVNSYVRDFKNTIDLETLYQRLHKPQNKLFEKYNQLKYIVKTWNFNTMSTIDIFYSKDASSSGLQMIALLLRSKLLAEATSISYDSSHIPRDIYQQFIDDFLDTYAKYESIFQFVKERIPELHQLFTKQILKLHRKELLYDSTLFGVYNYAITYLWNNPNFDTDAELMDLFSNNMPEIPGNKLIYTSLRPYFENEVKMVPKASKKSKSHTFRLEREVGAYQKVIVNHFLFDDIKPTNVVESSYETTKLGKLVHFVSAFLMASNLKLLLILNKPFEKYLNRKTAKMALMTTIYGSSAVTRIDQFVDAIKQQAMEDGVPFNDNDVERFRSIAVYLNKYLITFLEQEYSPALFLLKQIKSLCAPSGAKKGNLWLPQQISSEHCNWFYNPLKMEAYSKSIFNKSYKLHRYTNETDYNALSKGFVANYIQYIDALIASKFLKKMAKKNIPVMTIHDCFKCPIVYAKQLDSTLHECYLEVFEADYLYHHFHKQNPEFIRAMNTYKINTNMTPLYAIDFNNPNFIKA